MQTQCHWWNLHLTYQTNSADFFLNKIKKIREQFHAMKIHKRHTIGNAQVSMPSCKWTEQETLNIIKNMNQTTCIMDPCNTQFLLKFKEIITDAIATITNQSLTTGEFLDDWKVAAVRPLFKGLKHGYWTEELQTHKQPIFLIKCNRKGSPSTIAKAIWQTVPPYYPTTKVHIDNVT